MRQDERGGKVLICQRGLDGYGQRGTTTSRHLFRRAALGYDGGGRTRLGGDALTGKRSCLAIVLAAGEGTRMRSARPKVLHAIAGRSLLAHVLDAVRKAGGTMTAVVVGAGGDAVATEAQRVVPDAEIFVQAERRGTAHAVLAARAAIARVPDDVLVIFGDTPLIRPQTLVRIREALAGGAALVVLGFRPKDPAGYGRLVLDGKLCHGANPLLRWAVSNASVEMDPAGNRKLSKLRSRGRIDPLIAAVMACGQAAKQPEPIAYDFNRPLVLSA